MLSAFQASHHEGNIYQVLHIFAFMKKDPKLTIYFYPRFSNINPTSFSGISAG